MYLSQEENQKNKIINIVVPHFVAINISILVFAILYSISVVQMFFYSSIIIPFLLIVPLYVGIVGVIPKKETIGEQLKNIWKMDNKEAKENTDFMLNFNTKILFLKRNSNMYPQLSGITEQLEKIYELSKNNKSIIKTNKYFIETVINSVHTIITTSENLQKEEFIDINTLLDNVNNGLTKYLKGLETNDRNMVDDEIEFLNNKFKQQGL